MLYRDEERLITGEEKKARRVFYGIRAHLYPDCDVVTECATPEQAEIMREFTDMLNQASRDGGRKRARGEKVDWRMDPGHQDAFFRHLRRWDRDGPEPDKDSGAHPLVHAAWRALAIAWQETHGTGDEDVETV